MAVPAFLFQCRLGSKAAVAVGDSYVVARNQLHVLTSPGLALAAWWREGCIPTCTARACSVDMTAMTAGVKLLYVKKVAYLQYAVWACLAAGFETYYTMC